MIVMPNGGRAQRFVRPSDSNHGEAAHTLRIRAQTINAVARTCRRMPPANVGWNKEKFNVKTQRARGCPRVSAVANGGELTEAREVRLALQRVNRGAAGAAPATPATAFKNFFAPRARGFPK